MKKYIKIVALLLVFTFIVPLIISCQDSQTPIDTDGTDTTEGVEATETEETSQVLETTTDTEDTSDTESSDTTKDTESEDSSEPTDTEKPDDRTYTIVEKKKTDYTIVIPDSNGENLTDACNQLRATFLEEYNVSIPMYKESTFKTITDGNTSVPKIIIDAIKIDENSNEIKNSLDYNSFSIQMINGDLYIIGGTTESTVLAINYFIEKHMLSLAPSITFNNGIIYETRVAFPLGNLTVASNHISKYTIVYYDSYYAKQAAEKLQAELIDLIGLKLPIVQDSTKESAYEILVGKTNRAESKAVRAGYDRPNVNYDVIEKNGKLVIMAEGFSTLEVVGEKFISHLKTLDDKHNISGSEISGDILISDNADNVYEGNMLTRAANTDVRIMAWNMGGPGTSGQIDLAEKLADTILKNLPDVFGTNEFYDPPSGAYRTTFNTVLKEISEYYYEIESENDFPNDSRLESFVKSRGPRPQKIFIRKDAGIKVIAAGWRYTEYQKDINYRSFPWAVLETKDGDKFIYTVSHYTNMTNDNVAAIEQLETVAYAQAQSGSSEALPTILSGDLWMAIGKGAYKYFTDAGYKDAQREALVNDNNNIGHGTFHDYGKFEPHRSITDRIMYSAGMVPLKFKVITSLEALDSSDHSPVCADFKFN